MSVSQAFELFALLNIFVALRGIFVRYDKILGPVVLRNFVWCFYIIVTINSRLIALRWLKANSIYRRIEIKFVALTFSRYRTLILQQVRFVISHIYDARCKFWRIGYHHEFQQVSQISLYPPYLRYIRRTAFQVDFPLNLGQSWNIGFQRCGRGSQSSWAQNPGNKAIMPLAYGLILLLHVQHDIN